MLSFLRNKMGDSGSDCVIKVHPESTKPTKAWDKLKVKQTVTKVTPLSPDTPIKEDHIRFVCISDTHNQIEKRSADFVPQGDVLLHAGDFTNIGLPKEIKSFNDYLGVLPHGVKVVIAGNHDLTLDAEMVRDERQYLDRQFSIRKAAFEDFLEKEGLDNSRQLLTNCIYLEDSGIDICGIKIFGSPWQPDFGHWGFNLLRGGPLLEKWNKIPDDTDILITHGPPIGHGDYCTRFAVGLRAGCVELLNTIQQRVKPLYHIFGHIHEGHGDYCSSGMRAGCVELLSTIQKRVKPLYHLFGHIHEGYGVTSDGHTTYINASTCTLRYKPDNPPVVFDFPIPAGHSKEELASIPRCNL